MNALIRTGRHVIFAVLPIAATVTVLHLTFAPLPRETLTGFLGALALVVAGLTLFLFAAETDLLPIGRAIGAAMPRLGNLWLMCALGGFMGIAVTVAEPDVRVLTQQVDLVSEGVISRVVLVLAVALGVGIMVALALLRVVLGIPLRRVLTLGYLLVLAMSAFAPAQFLPVAFDAGGVTTGPMTVPFIIALGLGVASVLSGRTASGDGFGYVGLASIGPIVAVLLLGILTRW
ncbi:MAG: DUF1538 domain-containing protein [Bacillota bacterium]|nr:DUF1538 domain-containing protein [Bacillota bacterium]